MLDVTQPPRPGPAQRVSVPTLSPSSSLYFGHRGRRLGPPARGHACRAGLGELALVGELRRVLVDAGRSIGIGDVELDLDLRHWVNDAAMAIFFLVVGLEISREVTTGELRDRRTVAVAGAAARSAGCWSRPLIYLAFNPPARRAHGWGIVMSTDTAFVLGILALFGPALPRPAAAVPARRWRSSTTSAPSP